MSNQNTLKKFSVHTVIRTSAILFFIVLCLYRLSDISAFQVDEVMLSYDSYCISKWGCDRYGNSWPLYFVNAGGGGSSAPNIYFTALCIKLFGLSLASIRLPGVIMGVFGMVYFIKFSRNVFGDAVASIMALVYATTPHFVMRTQIMMDCFFALPFMFAAFYYIELALRENKIKDWAKSGFFCGLACYSYMAMLVPVTVFLILCFLWFLPKNKFTWKSALALIFPYIFWILPLVLVNIINILDIETVSIFGFTLPNLNTEMHPYRIDEVSTVPLLNEIASNLIEFWGTMSLRSAHYKNTSNMYALFGHLTYVTFILSVIGLAMEIVNIVKKKSHDMSFVSLSLLLSLMAFFMVVWPQSHRITIAYLPMMYFCASAIRNILNINVGIVRYSLTGVILILQILLFSLFAGWYYSYSNQSNPSGLTHQDLDILNNLNYYWYDDLLAVHPDIDFDTLHTDGIEEEYAISYAKIGDFSPSDYRKLADAIHDDISLRWHKYIDHELPVEESGVYIIHKINNLVLEKIHSLEQAGTIKLYSEEYSRVWYFEIEFLT